MKVLVTGGAGFLGSHLVDALADRGDQIIVLDNFYRGSLSNLAGHLENDSVMVSTDDIRDYDAVLRAADGVEVIFHLAAQSNVMGALQNPDYCVATNIMGTSNVLRAAVEARVRRVIFASSREVYGEPASLPVSESATIVPKGLYGATKVVGELHCQLRQGRREIECQILRFANIYGPRDRDRVIPLWVDRARAGEPLIIYGGEQILDFIPVSHCVRVLLAAAECEPKDPVNVGSGVGTRLLDLAQQIIELSSGHSVIELRPAREVEVVRFIADITKMRKLLGIEPVADPLEALPALLGGVKSREEGSVSFGSG